MSKQKHKPKQQDLKSSPVKNTPAGQPASSKHKSTNQTPWFENRWAIAVPLLITFLCYIPTFQNEFVNWDDAQNIYENPWVQTLTWDNIKSIFTHDVIGGYNPLSIFTFAIERAVFGVDNWAKTIHTTNLVLHLLCVYFVFRLAVEMGMKRWGALLLALLFGIHPMRVESVAWATERKDVLFGVFYFAALFNYVKYLKSNSYIFLNKNLLIAFGLFVFSLFAKVQAVSLPLSMLAIDYYFKRPIKFNLIVEKIHFFIGSLIIGVVNVMLLKAANTITDDTQTNYTFFDRIFVAGHTFAVYIAKFIFPYKMLPLYSYPPTIPPTFYITSLLFVASCVGVWWAYRNGWTTVVFAWLFFFVNFIFVSQIVGAGQGFLADRFTYIAYFGFFFLLIHALTEGGIFEKNKTAVNIGFAAYLIMCCVMTWNQVKVWKNGETLWTHQINNGEPTVTAWRNRGSYLRDNKQFDRALSDLNKAISLKSDGSTYNSRGKMLMDMGKPEMAVHDYTMALKLKPDMWEALANRGAAYGSLNKLDSAMVDLSKVLSHDSLHVNALLNRGTAYGAMGKNDLSIIDLTKVVDLNPSEKNAYLNRYLAYRETGQLEKAISDCSSYINLDKNISAVWTDRGAIKKQMGRCGEAIPDFNEAIRLAPANGIAYAERAGCHFQMGNAAQGKADAQAAVQKGAGTMIDPNWLKN